jgi:hypothetical protein
MIKVKNISSKSLIYPSKTSNKRGQIKLSFGMIFSIILIVIFIAFAFYAIQKFLDMQRTVQIEQFLNKLQLDIDKVWQSSQVSQEEEYFLPSKIEEVCFEDGERNLIFRSSNFIEGRNIKHIDIEKITENDNPFCVKNTNRKLKITLKKDYGEALVTITKT